MYTDWIWFLSLFISVWADSVSFIVFNLPVMTSFDYHIGVPLTGHIITWFAHNLLKLELTIDVELWF